MSRLTEKRQDYVNALRRLDEAIAESKETPGSTTLKDGVIQRFELTYELCWKLIKFYLEYEGIKGPRVRVQPSVRPFSLV